MSMVTVIATPIADKFDLGLIQRDIVEWLMENGEAHPDSDSTDEESQQYGCLVGTKGGFTYTHAPTLLPHMYSIRGHSVLDLMHVGITHITSKGGLAWFTYTSAPHITVDEVFRRGLWMENILGYDLSKYIASR